MTSSIDKVEQALFGTLQHEEAETEIMNIIEISSKQTFTEMNLLISQAEFIASEFGNTSTTLSKLQEITNYLNRNKTHDKLPKNISI